MAKTYKDLAVYQNSFELFVEVLNFTMELPKYELYEQGSQLRRSSDSVNSNIVEGYWRKDYKMILYDSLLIHMLAHKKQ